MDWKDYKTEDITEYRRKGGGQHHNGPCPGVIKVTHIPTGLFAIGAEERSQLANRIKAREKLDVLLKRCDDE